MILGAGASLANALYFRGQRMPHTRPPLDGSFFAAAQGLAIALPTSVRTYLANVVGINPTPPVMRELRMEEVFKDVFFDFQDDHTNRVALDAYIDLVDLYLRVLQETTNWLADDARSGAPVGRLIANAADAADEVTVLTFNHDLNIENEIQRRARLRQRWCLEEGYGTFSAELRPTSALGAPAAVFQRHANGNCDHSRPIRVLKLHGSLNWVNRINSQRPTANFLAGSSNSPIHLLERRVITSRQTMLGAGGGRTRWLTWPVVIPPVYAKQALRARINAVWQDSRDALEQADRVVVFGYSLPVIDVEAEKLIERALARNFTARWLDVIDPAPGTATRYAALSSGSRPIRWYPTVAEFLAHNSFS